MQTTIEQINNAFIAANRAYVARNGANAKLGKTGMQNDIAAGLSVFSQFTNEQIKTLASYGIDWANVSKGIASATNVKIARRLPQFLGFIVSAGDARYLQGSAKTALLEYCALHAGARSKDALRFASTGKGNESTSDEISVQRARAVLKAFGSVKPSSRETQASVSFSKGGLLDILGMVTPWAKGDTMPALIDCKLGRALGALLAGLSESQIQLWAKK